MVHFFFFQAEDGIRDKLVTGVQTCALPISDGSRRPALTRRWRSTSRRPPRGTSWARMPSPTFTCSRNENGQRQTHSGSWPSARTGRRTPRKRAGRRLPRPSATSAATMSSTCTRLSTGSAGRLATPTKTAARTALTIKNSSDMKGAFLVALLFLTLAAESSTSTLIYVSDYFSFVGADQHGRVAFALDNNRGRDGEAFQAEHFVVLHDEQ